MEYQHVCTPCTALRASHNHLFSTTSEVPLFPLAWCEPIKVSEVFLLGVIDLCLASTWGRVLICLHLPAPILFSLPHHIQHLPLFSLQRVRKTRQAGSVNFVMTGYEDQPSSSFPGPQICYQHQSQSSSFPAHQQLGLKAGSCCRLPQTRLVHYKIFTRFLLEVRH